MAVANTKSSSVTAFDANQLVPSYKHAGPKLSSKDYASIAAADDDGSVYRMVRLPSNAVISQLNVLNDAITGGSDFDLGVYDTEDNGGAVVDKDLFASAISFVGQRTLPLNALFESGTVDIVENNTRLWELLGLSEDPQKDYDICFTGNTVGSAAGDIALDCEWTQ